MKTKTHVNVPEDIMKDIQFDLIDVKLFQRNILDRSDFILLRSVSSNSEKIEILFETLKSKNEEQHENFLDVVKEDYSWLRDKCEILLQKMKLDVFMKSNTSPTSKLEPLSTPIKDDVLNTKQVEEHPGTSIPDSILIQQNNQKNQQHNDKLSQVITSEMMLLVKRNHRVVRGWTTLAHVLGMTAIVHTVRMRMVMNCEDIDACVLHLLQEWKGREPKSATLEKLVAALREECYNEVADELVEKFAS